ncbi:MAG: IS1182 family transposase [Kiloniellales bacterium]|nr:IS1182 family transposase [Kiloniellales bacterium]
MSKTFRPWNVDQAWLLPPAIDEFVPAGHPAHLVRDLVRETLDLGAIMAAYDEPRGYPPYHPAMMVAVLLYAYSQGVYSSRRIARALEERLDFMAVSALERPDFRTISDFRKRHLEALAGLFVQVLGLCREAGLVELGHVALDGTKLKANASKHKAMSYARMVKAEGELQAEIRAWLAKAEAADAAEDAEHGAERRGDEMPDWVQDKQRRLAKIRAAKAALEAKARAEAEAAASDGEGARRGRKPEPAQPKPSAQRNFTDPESRIMKGKDGFVQAYNGQLAVDTRAQVIVACDLSDAAVDAAQLGPLVDRIERNLERGPKEVSADVGYCSEANLQALDDRGIRGYVATGRQKHPAGGTAKRRGPLVQAMRRKLKRGGRRSRYRLRKQTVEPVIGQIKEARGFRQFLLRGLSKVQAEWTLVCTAHNTLKLIKAFSA